MSADELLQDAHRRAQALLPWLVNGSLREPERGWLTAHLEHCADCRRALELERRIAARITTEPVVEYAPQASLAKLWRRVDALPARSGGRWSALRGRARRLRRRVSLTRVLWVQALAILVLALGVGWLALRPDGAPSYRTLSRAPAVAVPHLQVVFEAPLTTAAMSAALQTVDGRIVDGPSAAGVFRVAVDVRNRAALDAAAQRLAAQPGVRFVAAQWPDGAAP